ncbi:MAG: hypothetical protein A3K65_00850 [Euryarchaeota archaeon RBG_16_68_12]|nr:MAG: hypothetical protein A3K65_00850 [Euryarchaeota archaeon RBG_16_68_12]
MFVTAPARVFRPDPTLRTGGIAIGALVLIGMLMFHAAALIPSYNLSVVRFGLIVASMALLDIALGLALIVTATVASRPATSDGTRRAVLLFAAIFLFAWRSFTATFFGRLFGFP